MGLPGDSVGKGGRGGDLWLCLLHLFGQDFEMEPELHVHIAMALGAGDGPPVAPHPAQVQALFPPPLFAKCPSHLLGLTDSRDLLADI